MKPGELLKEGVVVRHDEKLGVFVGREAEEGEALPAGHQEFRFGARRVFLSDAQAPIPPAGLHKRGQAVNLSPKGVAPVAKQQAPAEFPYFELYQDKAKKWRWRIKARNGQVLGDSGEGYATRSNCQEAVDRLNGVDWPLRVEAE